MGSGGAPPPIFDGDPPRLDRRQIEHRRVAQLSLRDHATEPVDPDPGRLPARFDPRHEGQDTERAAAERDVRQQIAFYASTPSYRPFLAYHGLEQLGRELSGLHAVSQRGWEGVTVDLKLGDQSFELETFWPVVEDSPAPAEPAPWLLDLPFWVAVAAGCTTLSAGELQQVEPGDILLPDHWFLHQGGEQEAGLEAGPVDWNEVRELADASYRQVALKRMLKALDA